MPDPGCSARWSASQASRCSAVLSRTTPSRSDSRSSEPRSTRTSTTELLGDVLGHPGVGRGGRGQHRDAVGKVGQQGADAAVVGPEVVTPVGDAVRLVDHEQPGRRRQPGQHLVAEARVVEPLGAHQQHVDLAGIDGVVDRLPLLDVGGVDRDRPDAGPLGRRDLVAHQGQQRRHDDRRPRALCAQQQRRHEVDRRLAPAGALHHQRPAAVDRQRLDRRPLVVAQPGVVAPDEGAQVPLGGGADVRRLGGCHGLCVGHAPCLPSPADNAVVLVHRGPGRQSSQGSATPGAATLRSRSRIDRSARS